VDTTWTVADSPYIVTSNITVKGTDGADEITTLTVEPGVAVRFNINVSLVVGASSGDPGALVAQGTETNPIVFTSNQATPSPGDWRGIKFYNTTDDAGTVLDYCTVRYAGYGNTGQIYIYNAAPALSHCTCESSSNYDLYYTGTVGGTVSGCALNSGIYLVATSSVDFTGNTFHYNNSYPIKAYADNVGDIVSGNTLNNLDPASFLEVNAGTISRDATWTAAVPYAITGNITVKGTDGADAITSLNILPGAVIKFNTYISINIGASSGDPGALIAQGTSDNQILFTSNQATPAPGDWYYIRFYNTTDDSTTEMDNCVVEYGGYTYGAIYLYDASPRIQNTTVRNSKNAGIYASGSGTSAAVVNCNTFSGNQNGIYWTAAQPPEMHSNNFNGNTSYGLYYNSTQTLNAEDNWWGDVAGPNTSGDAVYGNVDADPWSTQTNDCTGPVQNEPPHVPSYPTPADGAVRISIESTVSLSWIGGDPNPLDVVTYDLYWGISPGSLQLEAADLSQATYTKNSVDQGITYYWQIISKDDKGAETSGPVWNFTTDGDPPDLMISQVTADPAGNLQSGQTVTLTATILNSGSGPVVDSFMVDFRVDGASINTLPVGQILLAGQSVQINQTWTYTGGDPAIEVIADNQGQVTETNESNNSFSAFLMAIVDNSAPALTGTCPEDGTELQQIQQITATLVDSQGIVDDAAVIASFSVKNSEQQSIAGIVTESNDTFTFVPDSLPLPDSTYDVDLTAADTYGNTQTYSFGFTIDSQPPAKPTITGGTVDSGTIQPRPVQNTTGQFLVELTGTRDAGTSLLINGVQVVDVGDADWGVPLTLEPGSNALEIWLKDRAGNEGESVWVDIEVVTGNSVTFEYDAAGRIKRIHSNP